MLIVPMIGTPRKVAAESDYVLYRNLMKHWEGQAFANMVIPVEADGVEDGVNVRLWKIERFSNLYDQQVKLAHQIDELFHPVDGDYPVDCVLTSRAVMATYLNRMFWGRMMDRPPVPVIIVEPKAIDFSSTHNQICESELMMRALGYANTYSFFSTTMEKSVALTMCRRYLSPSMVARVDRESGVLPFGIRCAEIDAVRAGTKRRGKFTLFFGGRMNTNKRWDWVADLYLRMYKAGHDVNGVFVTPLSKAFDTRQYPGLTVVSGLTRGEYLRMLCSCHVAVNHSKEEGLSVGLLEQMYSGIIVWLPRAHWVAAMLGTFYEKYPFLYDNSKEVYARTREIMLDYEAEAAKMEPVRAFLREKYDDAHVCRDELGHIRGYVDRERDAPRVSDMVKALVREVADAEGPTVQFSRLCVKIRDKARMPELVFNRQTSRPTFPSKQSIYRWMLASGWHDTLTSADPMLVKVKAVAGGAQDGENAESRKGEKEVVGGANGG